MTSKTCSRCICVTMADCMHVGRPLQTLTPTLLELRCAFGKSLAHLRDRTQIRAAWSTGRHRLARTQVCRKPRHQTVRAQAATAEADVVVVGGGIIGLSVAFQLLNHASRPSVALLERKVPCSGATGAGKLHMRCQAFSAATCSKNVARNEPCHQHFGSIHSQLHLCKPPAVKLTGM